MPNTTPTIKIMISSTRQDLDQYRSETSKIIEQIAKEKQEKIHLIEISMEEKPQSGRREEAITISKKWVREADWIVLIVGFYYGTIPDDQDAETLSITEWEYRHAMELGKSVHVFLAGDRNTPEAYRASEEENNDLKDAYEDASKIQSKEIKRFRKELKQKHLIFFNNLEKYKKKLKQTLREHIDEITEAPLPPSLALPRLRIKIQSPSNKCIINVSKIKLYKEIHDILHKLRQDVIRPLRESILPKWEEDRSLESDLKERILSLGYVCGKYQGKIESASSSIDTGRFKSLLESIVQTNLFEDLSIKKPDLEDFQSKTGYFVAFVSDAFEKANNLMVRQHGLLTYFQNEIRHEVEKYKTKYTLTPEHARRINQQLESITEHIEHFDKVLNTHDRWQEMHEEFDELDGYKESTNFFIDKLKYLIKFQGIDFSRLIDEQIEHFKETDQNQDQFYFLKENWTELNTWNETEPSEPEKSALEIYKETRKEFDDVFFEVDQDTLKEVTNATDCIGQFEELLTILGKEAENA